MNLLKLSPMIFACALAACSDPAEPLDDSPPDNAAAVPAPSAAGTQSGRISQYTSLKSCKLVEEGKDEDWSTSRCDGLDGWTLQLDYSDARDDLALLRGHAEAKKLEITSLGTGGFNSLGETVEWRGDSGPGGFAPTTLIVRNRVVTDPKTPQKSGDALVVIDLRLGCVVAQVPPQPGQNDAARQIADAPSLACLKN